MIIWRSGRVVARGRSWAGALELDVLLDRPLPANGSTTPDVPPTVRALTYPLTGVDPQVGARVLLNVTALAKGLGTGGYALVVTTLPAAGQGEDTPGWAPPADPPGGPGHLVKARYTPLQTLVLGVDEQDSPHHATLRDADDLEAMPVVVADLHSALPAIIAGARFSAARAGRALPRVAYVMTDGGALPAWFSRTIDGLREAGWLAACLTVGQAYGGDLEAVSVHTGLLAARHVVGADLTIVAQGPGNLGTGTRWGFSGVSAGEAVNAAGVLGGRPVASLRVSGADARPRHHGVSHHSLTAYGRVALVPADVVVPVFPAGPVEGVPDEDGLPPLVPGSLDALGRRVRAQALGLVAPAGRHRLVEIEAGQDLLAALGASPVALTTMGRGLDEESGGFLASAAAGVHAERLTAGDGDA